MIDIIAGSKGKGKTKVLLDRVNEDIKKVDGSIVFIDKNNGHMYELNNQVRLIVSPDFGIDSTDKFIGFIAGILSQDSDLQKIYLDGFLKTAFIKGNLDYAIEELDKLSKKFDVDFVVSLSADASTTSEYVKKFITTTL